VNRDSNKIIKEEILPALNIAGARARGGEGEKKEKERGLRI
jgi:hypothetical protein